MTDYKAILDTYWPVIEKAIEVRKHYMGENEGDPKRVCSDVVGALIVELNKSVNACHIIREKE